MSKYDFIDTMAASQDSEFFNLCAKRVRDFNLAASGSFVHTKEAIAFQKSLVKEELLQELIIDGIEGKNRKLIIDALCDTFVVATYWDFLNLLEEAGAESSGRKSEEDIVKQAVEDTKTSLDIDYFSGHVLPSKLVEYMVKSYYADTPEGLVNDCATLMTILDFDYRKALDEVLSSNESKIPTEEDFLWQYHSSGVSMEDAIAEEEKRIESKSLGRYTGVKGTRVNGRVVFKDSNGKIMKPCTFFEPDLEAL